MKEISAPPVMKNYIWAVNSGVCFSESLEGDLGACTLVANASSLIHLHLTVVLKWNQCGQTHDSASINQLTSTWSVCLISIPPHLQVVVEDGGVHLHTFVFGSDRW